jgi:hypothetical protein
MPKVVDISMEGSELSVAKARNKLRGDTKYTMSNFSTNVFEKSKAAYDNQFDKFLKAFEVELDWLRGVSPATDK